MNFCNSFEFFLTKKGLIGPGRQGSPPPPPAVAGCSPQFVWSPPPSWRWTDIVMMHEDHQYLILITSTNKSLPGNLIIMKILFFFIPPTWGLRKCEATRQTEPHHPEQVSFHLSKHFVIIINFLSSQVQRCIINLKPGSPWFLLQDHCGFSCHTFCSSDL